MKPSFNYEEESTICRCKCQIIIRVLQIEIRGSNERGIGRVRPFPPPSHQVFLSSYPVHTLLNQDGVRSRWGKAFITHLFFIYFTFTFNFLTSLASLVSKCYYFLFLFFSNLLRTIFYFFKIMVNLLFLFDKKLKIEVNFKNGK